MVRMNARQVHYVPEIPTYENVNVRDRRDCDVLSIGEHVGGENPFREIAPGQFIGLRRQSNRLDVGLWNLRQSVAYRRWRRFKLAKRQFRENEPEIAANERVHEPSGMDAELLVLAAADDRRVRVDATNHGLILR